MSLQQNGTETVSESSYGSCKRKPELLNPLFGRSSGQGLIDELFETGDASFRKRGTAAGAAQHFHRELHLVPVQDLGRCAAAFGGKRFDIGPEEKPQSIDHALEFGSKFEIEALGIVGRRISRRFRGGEQ